MRSPLLDPAPVLRVLSRRAGVQDGAGGGLAEPHCRAGCLPRYEDYAPYGAET